MLQLSHNTLKEIWDLQSELNQLVGRDLCSVFRQDKELAIKWSQHMFDEMAHEVFEAKNCFYHKWWVKEVKDDPDLQYTIIDKAKLKLEMIDVLHFLISGCQGFTFFEQFAEICAENIPYLYIPTDSDEMCYCELGVMVRTEDSIRMLAILYSVCEYLGMTEQDILDVYRLKHATNIKRQHDGYSLATKTEKDNEAIEERIR